MLYLYYNMMRIGGTPVLLVTEQGYYDERHDIDDGTCPDRGTIDAALVKAGAEVLSPSMYGTGRSGAQAILKALRADGHWLAAKPEMGTRFRETGKKQKK